MTTNNEPLELLANELRQSNVRQYTCINDLGYSQLERNIVTILTEWQKEKDKIVIDKLVAFIAEMATALQKALSTLTGMHSNLKEDNALLLEALKELYEFNLGKSYYLDILLNNAEYAIQKTESK